MTESDKIRELNKRANIATKANNSFTCLLHDQGRNRRVSEVFRERNLIGTASEIISLCEKRGIKAEMVKAMGRFLIDCGTFYLEAGSGIAGNVNKWYFLEKP